MRASALVDDGATPSVPIAEYIPDTLIEGADGAHR
jgi:hypothetical protein